jgi:hypothetical protein
MLLAVVVLLAAPIGGADAAIQVFTDRAAFEAAVARSHPATRLFDESFDFNASRIASTLPDLFQDTAAQISLSSRYAGYFQLSPSRVDATSSQAQWLLVPRQHTVYGIGLAVALTDGTSFRSLSGAVQANVYTGDFVTVRQAVERIAFLGFVSDEPIIDFELSNSPFGVSFLGLDRVTIAAVTPIPGALPLLATALGGLALVWRRRRG